MSAKRSRSLSDVAAVLALTLSAATQPSPPEGRWSSRIEVPGNPLDITVDPVRDGEASWRGTIDIPGKVPGVLPGRFARGMRLLALWERGKCQND